MWPALTKQEIRTSRSGCVPARSEIVRSPGRTYPQRGAVNRAAGHRKPSWRAQSPARPSPLLSQYRARNSSRCSSVWAPRGSVICSSRPDKRRLALSSLTNWMPWGAAACLARSAAMMKREQTPLNQLLAELDGFDPSTGENPDRYDQSPRGARSSPARDPDGLTDRCWLTALDRTGRREIRRCTSPRR